MLDDNLPTPEQDTYPGITKFMLDIGKWYEELPPYGVDPRYPKKTLGDFNSIKKYLSDTFIDIVRKELKLG